MFTASHKDTEQKTDTPQPATPEPNITPSMQDVITADKTKTDPQLTGNPSIDPNIELYQWLQDKNYKLSLEALTEDTPFIAERGFVATDKPLLVIVCKKKGN